MSLHCTVCSGCFSNKPDWYCHLLHKRHLSLARKALLNWDGEERACALVVFAKLPVGKDDKIVQYLSKDFGTFVTDFVWWNERPRTGFVQFESRDKVREILGSLQDQKFQIDQLQFCYVRDGASIPELEWTQLLPDADNDTCISHLKINPPPSPEPVATPPDDNRQQRVSTLQLQSSSSLASSSGRFGLQHHLRSIRELTEIPDEEYIVALDLASRLQEALNVNWNNQERSTTVYKATVFRHWTLKLQYVPKNSKTANSLALPILIYKETLDGQVVSSAGGGISLKELLEIATKVVKTDKASKQYFFSYELISIDYTTDGQGSFSYQIKLPTSGTPFYFRIVNNGNQGQAVEAQFWRLIQYMCTFDPRCYPVLAVINYWAKINSVTVGKPHNTCKPGEMSDPFGLIWLVMSFLNTQGLIPSNKLILEQLDQNQTFLGAYITSPEGIQFFNSWMKITRGTTKIWHGDSEQFAEEVFTLVYKFFNRHGSRLPELIFQIDHPFFENWKISTSSMEEAKSTMKKTELKFEDCYDMEGKFKRDEMDLEEFLSLFKV